MKQLLILTGVAAVSLALAPLYATETAPTLIDKLDVFSAVPAEVAKIGDTVITKDMVIDEFTTASSQGSFELTQAEIQEHLPEMVRAQVQKELIRQEMARQNIVPSYENAKARLIGDFNRKSDHDKREFISKAKSTAAKIESYFERMAKRDSVQQKAAEMELLEKAGVNCDVSVSAKDIDDLLEAGGNKIKKVHAWHILITPKHWVPEEIEEAKKLADDLLARVKADPDKFKELAYKYSDCTTSEIYGDLGYISLGSMTPNFEKAAFSLKAGEFYPEPVATPFGYHIIYVDDVLELDPAPDQARAIVAKYHQNRFKTERELYLDRLAKQYNVVYLVDMSTLPPAELLAR